MKKVLFVHGYNGNPEYVWFPQLKKLLEEKGFEVFVPQLPVPNLPVLEDWMKTISDITSKFDDKDIVISHSGGARAVVRVLHKQNKKIKHLFMFAPVLAWEYFTDKFIEKSEKNSEKNQASMDNWVTMNTYKEDSFDLSLVNSLTPVTAIYSNDDPICKVESSILLPKEWRVERWDECKHFWNAEEPKLFDFILNNLEK